MRNIPVDINAFLSKVVGPVGFDPVVDYDTGEHRRNNDGVPRWKLTVLYQDQGRKKELVEIGFAAPQPPERASESDQLVLQGLVARHWENTNAYGTSSGVALSADTVGFTPAQRRPARPGSQADAA